MLYFCTHKEEDGRYYLITNRDPRQFYNWPGWELCNPKIARITAKEAKRIAGIPSSATLNCLVVYIDIIDWNYYMDVINPRLKYL